MEQRIMIRDTEAIKAIPAPPTVVGMGTPRYVELVEEPRRQWAVQQLVGLREQARASDDMAAVAAWNVAIAILMSARPD